VRAAGGGPRKRLRPLASSVPPRMLGAPEWSCGIRGGRRVP
jgi:hypothetical protein